MPIGHSEADLRDGVQAVYVKLGLSTVIDHEIQIVDASEVTPEWLLEVARYAERYGFRVEVRALEGDIFHLHLIDPELYVDLTYVVVVEKEQPTVRTDSECRTAWERLTGSKDNE